jgi:hypothetical protein
MVRFQHLASALADDNAGAMVLPVTMRGMIDPSAIRSLLMP